MTLPDPTPLNSNGLGHLQAGSSKGTAPAAGGHAHRHVIRQDVAIRSSLNEYPPCIIIKGWKKLVFRDLLNCFEKPPRCFCSYLQSSPSQNPMR